MGGQLDFWPALRQAPQETRDTVSELSVVGDYNMQVIVNNKLDDLINGGGMRPETAFEAVQIKRAGWV